MEAKQEVLGRAVGLAFATALSLAVAAYYVDVDSRFVHHAILVVILLLNAILFVTKATAKPRRRVALALMALSVGFYCANTFILRYPIDSRVFLAGLALGFPILNIVVWFRNNLQLAE